MKTIRQRLEEYIARRSKKAKDIYVSVFNNSTEYSPEDFGFYLSDFEEVKDYRQLSYKLDSEKRYGDKLALGFTHITKTV